MILRVPLLKGFGVGFALMLTGYLCPAQCKQDFKVTTVTDEVSGKGKIFISADLSGTVSLKLYNIDKNNQLVSEKSVSAGQLTNNKPVFENLSSATYLIQCTWGNCTATVGGLEGIQINKSQKK
jgi:hypothetical protein